MGFPVRLSLAATVVSRNWSCDASCKHVLFSTEIQPTLTRPDQSRWFRGTLKIWVTSTHYEIMSSLRWACMSTMAVLLLTGGEAWSQVEIERPTAGERNAVGLSAFVAPNLTQGTYFYGLVGEYNRLLTSHWGFAVSGVGRWE